MRSRREPHLKKIQALWTLISAHWEALEADFERYYHRDLLELYRSGPGLGLRKASVLISYLPPESATATALRNEAARRGEAGSGSESDPAEGQWSLAEMLTASVIDELRWLRFDYRSANTDQPGKSPLPVPRPGVKSKSKRKLSKKQAMALDPRMRGEWPNG